MRLIQLRWHSRDECKYPPLIDSLALACCCVVCKSPITSQQPNCGNIRGFCWKFCQIYPHKLVGHISMTIFGFRVGGGGQRWQRITQNDPWPIADPFDPWPVARWLISAGKSSRKIQKNPENPEHEKLRCCFNSSSLPLLLTAHFAILWLR